MMVMMMMTTLPVDVDDVAWVAVEQGAEICVDICKLSAMVQYQLGGILIVVKVGNILAYNIRLVWKLVVDTF